MSHETVVDPAELRFTQDSIKLHFKDPSRKLTVRQAVRRIAEKKMSPDEFPPICVVWHNDRFWSIDNRRLWVFRFARCGSIAVRVQNRMHPRLEEIISNPDSLRLMGAADFFPRVRGCKDRAFDRLYPPPISLKLAGNFVYLCPPPPALKPSGNLDRCCPPPSSLKPSVNYDSRVHADIEKAPVPPRTPPRPTARYFALIALTVRVLLWICVFSLAIILAMEFARGVASCARMAARIAGTITNDSRLFLGQVATVARNIVNAFGAFLGHVGSFTTSVASFSRMAATTTVSVAKTITNDSRIFLGQVANVARNIINAIGAFFGHVGSLTTSVTSSSHTAATKTVNVAQTIGKSSQEFLQWCRQFG